jgi:hypothetical protein
VGLIPPEEYVASREKAFLESPASLAKRPMFHIFAEIV